MTWMARLAARVAPFAILIFVLALVLVELALAQAGGGSSSFGGGGGGSSGGGSSFGGSGSGSGSGEGGWVGAVIVFGVFGLIALWVIVSAIRFRIKLNRREGAVHRASAEAAEDDAYFAGDQLETDAGKLFREAQTAWDARDRERLSQLVSKELMYEWKRRLDDFDRKGWHNRVEVLDEPQINYVGLKNYEDDRQDRAVVRIHARLRSYVLNKQGQKIMRKGSKSDQMVLTEYWTLARANGGWIVASIEQSSEGDHHLDEEIIASPWSDSRVADEALTEVAVADKVPEGFTTADLAEIDFDEDARARALDLSLADARFMPDLLEAAARRAVAGWAEAVDGEDAALEQVASPEAVNELLYAGDASRQTRLVVRGPRVKSIEILAVDVDTEPATMTVQVELWGRRYVEDRDTAAVVSGDKDSATTFTERWTLALDGRDDAPWRLVDASAAPAA